MLLTRKVFWVANSCFVEGNKKSAQAGNIAKVVAMDLFGPQGIRLEIPT